MVKDHPDFITPPDNARLWKYMDVGRFLALLQAKSLYFARKRELDDPWEGAHPASLIKRIADTFLPSASGDVVHLYKQLAEQAVLNCWHEDDDESVAMWSLYTTGREGVAIRTTIQRLKQVLQANPYEVTIARVLYVDYERDGYAPTGKSESRFNALDPLFCKRQSYAHEREVRALVAFPDEPALKAKVAEIVPKLGDIVTIPPSEHGLLLPVDLEILIEKIVVSPTYPQWAIGALEDAVKNASLSLRVEQSDLIRPPR